MVYLHPCDLEGRPPSPPGQANGLGPRLCSPVSLKSKNITSETQADRVNVQLPYDAATCKQ